MNGSFFAEKVMGFQFVTLLLQVPLPQIIFRLLKPITTSTDTHARAASSEHFCHHPMCQCQANSKLRGFGALALVREKLDYNHIVETPTMYEPMLRPVL